MKKELSYEDYIRKQEKYIDSKLVFEMENSNWLDRCARVMAIYIEKVKGIHIKIDMKSLNFNINASKIDIHYQGFRLLLPLDVFLSKDYIEETKRLLGSDDSYIAPCPFCGSKNIDYSIKTAGGTGYHMAMYCKDCNSYGKRVLIKPTETRRSDIEKNKQYYNLALSAWNTRSSL